MIRVIEVSLQGSHWTQRSCSRPPWAGAETEGPPLLYG